MALHFQTDDPIDLLRRYKAAIDVGHIKTWSYDEDGDFTHTADQWIRTAWLRPKVALAELKFYILTPKDTKLSRTTYAVFHGRFIESMLTHCDEYFTNGYASALPEDGDIL
jgi:hypothetical protein